MDSRKKSSLVSSKFLRYASSSIFLNKVLFKFRELIDIALKTVLRLKITWAEARASAALYGQSLSPYFLHFHFRKLYQRDAKLFCRKSSCSLLSEYFTPALTLTYTVLIFGQTRSTSESAGKLFLWPIGRIIRRFRLVIQTVMDNYYDYIYQKQLLIARKRIRQCNSNF